MKSGPDRFGPVPRVAEALLSLFVAPEDESILGDLAEEYVERALPRGRILAHVWYWKEVFGAIRAVTGRRWSRKHRKHGRGWGMESISRDLWQAARTIARKPGAALIAVLTIALGVGVNAAIFSVVDGVLFRPLPFSEPDRLVTIWAEDRELGDAYLQIAQSALPTLEGFQGVEALAGYNRSGVLVTDDAGDPVRLSTAFSVSDIFSVLGVGLALGRSPSPDEFTAGDNVVVISDRLWKTRYASDPDILGRAIATDQGLVSVIGVTHPGFDFPTGTDLWSPPPSYFNQDSYVSVLARVASGTDPADLTRRLRALKLKGQSGFRTERDDLTPWAEPLREGLVNTAQTPLLLLLAAAAMVLLLASVNVANLLLAQGLARKQEWALRSALGAGRGRIIRQVMIESVLVALVGGSLALVGVWASFDAVISLVPEGFPRVEEITFDSRVFTLMMALAITAGLCAGLVPALQASRTAPIGGLGKGSRGATPSDGHRLQSVLMSTEVALGTILVVGATVLLLTLKNLFAVDPGFRTDVLTVRAMNLGMARVRAGDTTFDPRQAWQQIIDRVEGLAGIESAATAAVHPMEREFVVNVDVVGAESDGAGQPSAMFLPISEHYLETVGIPLLSGRHLDRTDDSRSAGVTLVNETFVRLYMGEGDPLGRTIKKSSVGGPWGADETVEVVGVVGDVKSQGLGRESEPMMFVPLHQTRFGYLRLFVRSSSDPRVFIPSLREIIWDVDPTVPLPNFQMMDDVIQESVAQEVFLSKILGVFAGLGLLIAFVGVYGVVSFAVGQRTREIGIRRALGADRASVARLVAHWSIVRVGIGVVIGVLGALMLSGLLKGFLFGVSVADPGALLAVAGTMALAGALATVVPARRALAVDPLVALKEE